MAAPASYKSLNGKFKKQRAHIQGFFPNFVSLVEKYTYDVVVAYCFFRLEQAYNRTLYGGVRKLHRVNSDLASTVIDKQHLTREGFLELFTIVFAKPITKDTQDKIKFAEKTRDRIIHGKTVSDKDARQCLSDIIDFAVLLDDEVQQIAKFSPFNDMRGITGQASSLDKKTSRWVLKGMGFAVS